MAGRVDAREVIGQDPIDDGPVASLQRADQARSSIATSSSTPLGGFPAGGLAVEAVSTGFSGRPLRGNGSERGRLLDQQRARGDQHERRGCDFEFREEHAFDHSLR